MNLSSCISPELVELFEDANDFFNTATALQWDCNIFGFRPIPPGTRVPVPPYFASVPSTFFSRTNRGSLSLKSPRK